MSRSSSCITEKGLSQLQGPNQLMLIVEITGICREVHAEHKKMCCLGCILEFCVLNLGGACSYHCAMQGCLWLKNHYSWTCQKAGCCTAHNMNKLCHMSDQIEKRDMNTASVIKFLTKGYRFMRFVFKCSCNLKFWSSYRDRWLREKCQLYMQHTYKDSLSLFLSLSLLKVRNIHDFFLDAS
jgi:hypothetical protein